MARSSGSLTMAPKRLSSVAKDVRDFVPYQHGDEGPQARPVEAISGAFDLRLDALL